MHLREVLTLQPFTGFPFGMGIAHKGNRPLSRHPWPREPEGSWKKVPMAQAYIAFESMLAIRPQPTFFWSIGQRMAKKRNQWPQPSCLWTLIHRIAPTGKRS